MKTIRFFLLFGAFLTILGSGLYAQGGLTCDVATPAVIGDNLADNTGYTDQWYAYTATMDGKLVVASCDTNTFYDTYVAIYEGSCGSLIELGYDDSYCSPHARLVIPIQAGITYYIYWPGWWTDATYNWTLEETPAAPGEICSNALTAVAGTNITDLSGQGEQWFAYTATMDGKITISNCNDTIFEDTWLNVKDACIGFDIVNADNACMYRETSSFGVTAGQTYYVRWGDYGYNSVFEWTLTEEAALPGEFCNVPKAAVQGANFADHAGGRDQWYTYTATNYGWLNISACDSATEDTYLQVWSLCPPDGWLFGEDWDYCGLQSYLRINMEPGVTYYIRWSGLYTSGTYYWSLWEELPPQGQTCTNPFIAVEGPNAANHSGYFDLWYNYTAPSNGNITISTCGQTVEDTYVDVMTGPCGNTSYVTSSDDACGSQSEVTFPAGAGTTYIIKWGGYYTQNSYNWILTLDTNIVSGEACEFAMPAIAGVNVANHSTGKDQWYSYTATMNGVIELSTCGLTTEDTKVEAWADNCQGTNLGVRDDVCGSQTYLMFPCETGRTYYIGWRAQYTSGIYNWNLNERVPAPGELCMTAIDAVADTNITNHAGDIDQWFKYTATMNGVIDIYTCGLTTEDTRVEVWGFNCGSTFIGESQDDCGLQSRLMFNAIAGTTYYINWSAWNTNGIYPWVLEERVPVAGEICETAIPAVNGINTADHSGGKNQWFSYTATIDGLLIASSCGETTEDTQVEIWASCYSGAWWENDDGCGTQSEVAVIVSPGQTYYILWKSGKTSGTYNWTLTERTKIQGEYCENPIVAVAGINTSEHVGQLDQYFVYTPATDGVINISTCGLTTWETSLFVFTTDCYEGSPVNGTWSNCWPQSGFKFRSLAGETYYIRWSGWNINGSYDWMLEDRAELPGEFCDNAIPVGEGRHTADHTGDGERWFSFTSATNTPVTITSCGLTNETTMFDVYDACGGYWVTSGYYDCGDQARGTFNATAGVTYYIVWHDNGSNPVYDWDLKLTDLQVWFYSYNVSTYGGSDGFIDISIYGGVPPYTYAWSHGAFTQDVGGLTPGSYTVTVTDNKGYSETVDIYIGQPPIPGADYGNAPDWSWVRKYGGSENDYFNELVTDASGNTYAAGAYSGSVTIGGSNFTASGQEELLVTKINSTGGVSWVRTATVDNGWSFIWAQGITLDAANNLYVTGSYFSNTATFGATVLDNWTGTNNCFVAKYSSTGTLLWARDYDLGGNEIGQKIAVDETTGEVYLLIHQVNFTAHTGFTPVSSHILMLDAAGNVIWTNSTEAKIVDITTWTGGGLWFVGAYQGTAYFDTIYMEFNNFNVFVGGMSPDGTFAGVGQPYFDNSDPRWVGTTEAVSYVSGIEMDPYGNAYVIGSSRFQLWFNPTLSLSSDDPWQFRGFIWKLDSMGNSLWAKHTGSDNNYFDNIKIQNTDILINGYNFADMTIDGESIIGQQGEFVVEMDTSGAVSQLVHIDGNMAAFTASGTKIYWTNWIPDLAVIRATPGGPHDWEMKTTGDNGSLAVWYHTDVDPAGNIYMNSRIWGYNDMGTDTVTSPTWGNMVAKFDNQGNMLWNGLINNRGGASESITVDKDGNLVALGTYYDTVTIGEMAQITNNTFSMGAYIAKGSQETLVWLKNIEGKYIFPVGSVVTDDLANVYVLTTFQDSIIVNGTLYQGTGAYSMALLKYSTDGALQWIRLLDGDGTDMGRDLATDGRNIYICGRFTGNPTYGTTTLYNLGSYDVFVTKVDPNGNVLWAWSGGDIGWETAQAIVADKDGYSYISGFWRQTEDFGFYVLKMKPDGTEDWLAELDAGNGGSNYKMGLDPAGNVYFGGNFDEYLRLPNGDEFVNPGTGNTFVASLTNTGDLRWVKTIDGTNGMNGLFSVRAYGVDNVVVAGRIISDKMIFDDQEIYSTSENTFMAMINFVDKPLISFIKTNVTTTGGFDGEIDLTVTGGTPPYTYSWSNGAFTQDIKFLMAGTYIVTVTDFLGQKSDAIIIIEEPGVAGCEIYPQFGYALSQDTVWFANLTSGYEYFWDFGDGYYSVDENPVHAYDYPGMYWVCMTAYDPLKDCSEQVCNLIETGTVECYTDFGFFYDETDPSIVHFTDMSMGDISLWYWNFGDGDFSSVAYESHQFTKPGKYYVCLFTLDESTGCQSEKCMQIEVGAVEVMADFNFMVDPDSLILRLTDQSIGAITNWYWTFGDGSYTDQQKASHTYWVPGLYQVCLFVSDDNANFDDICMDIQVGQPACELDANFTYIVSSVGSIVQFADRSFGDATSWFWDFGDGMTSSKPNPMHGYAQNGLYQVKLSVQNTETGCYDQNIEYIQVGEVACYSKFNYNIDQASSTVSFSDNSSANSTVFFWSFGDGYYSVEQNPVHSYDWPGMYYVSLTVMDETGLCMDFMIEPLQVGTVECHASFNYFIDSLTNATFFRSSIMGSATDLLWFFGDGSYATDANPVHLFEYPGYYSVGLNVFNSDNGCMDYYEEIILIGSRGIDVMADFIYTTDETTKAVQFMDRSKGDIAGYIWDFGDGSPLSSTQDPLYTYQDGGFYFVCLTAVSTLGITATGCQFIQVAADLENSCLAKFYYTTDSVSVSASFSDASFGNADSWYWYFGDGESSTEQNPVHQYGEAGIYLVSLNIKNTTNGCTSIFYDLVPVSQGKTGLIGDFGYDIDSSSLKAESYPVDYVGVSLGDAQKFKWSFGDGSFDSTSLQPTHIYSAPGTYYVCFEVSNPVSGESSLTCDSVKVGAPVGMDEFNMGGVLEVYPNPFNEQAKVIYRIEESSFVDLAVYDMMGRKVKVLVYDQKASGTHEIILKSVGMEHGVYYLMMNSNQGRTIRKVIME